MAYLMVKGDDARRLREMEAASAKEDDENQPWNFFWHDGGDHWLYETGMVKHFGTGAVFFDTKEQQWLVFTGDSVGIINASDVTEIKPPVPKRKSRDRSG